MSACFNPCCDKQCGKMHLPSSVYSLLTYETITKPDPPPQYRQIRQMYTEPIPPVYNHQPPVYDPNTLVYSHQPPVYDPRYQVYNAYYHAFIDSSIKATITEEARKEARKEAREEARKEAIEEAREEARKEAREEARKEAREEARKEAREEARKEAREEARKEAREARKKARKDKINKFNTKPDITQTFKCYNGKHCRYKKKGICKFNHYHDSDYNSDSDSDSDFDSDTDIKEENNSGNIFFKSRYYNNIEKSVKEPDVKQQKREFFTKDLRERRSKSKS
jgi:hypothetical protein